MKTLLRIALIAGTIGVLHGEDAAPAAAPKNAETPAAESPAAKTEAKPSKSRRRGVPAPAVAFKDLSAGANYKPQKATAKASGKGTP